MGLFGDKCNAYGHKLSKESIEKISIKKKGKRVSIRTEFKKGDPRIIGPNNINWRGGIMKLYDRRDHNNTKWSRAVLKRDAYTCKMCGYKKVKNNDLVSHHIFSYKEFPYLRYVVNNGITLCRICHHLVHKSNKR